MMNLLAKFAYFISMIFLSRKARREIKQNDYTFGDLVGATVLIIVALVGVGLLIPLLPALLPIAAVILIFYLIGRKS